MDCSLIELKVIINFKFMSYELSKRRFVNFTLLLSCFWSVFHVMKVNDEFEDNRVIVSVIVSYINAL